MASFIIYKRISINILNLCPYCAILTCLRKVYAKFQIEGQLCTLIRYHSGHNELCQNVKHANILKSYKSLALIHQELSLWVTSILKYGKKYN